MQTDAVSAIGGDGANRMLRRIQNDLGAVCGFTAKKGSPLAGLVKIPGQELWRTPKWSIENWSDSIQTLHIFIFSSFHYQGSGRFQRGAGAEEASKIRYSQEYLKSHPKQ